MTTFSKGNLGTDRFPSMLLEAELCPTQFWGS